MKAFLSFSSKDRPFVAKLKARLKAQPLDLWDYSNEGEEIPGGAEIDSYLSDRVSQAELFLPLVTPHSVASHYTRIEVRTAIERFRQCGLPRIIPLVDTAMLQKKNWGKDYEPLRKIRYFEIDSASREHWEEAVRRICADLKLSYRGLLPDNTLLPFMARFECELKDARARDPERADGTFDRLERIRNDFVIAIDEADYERAYRLVDFFLATCEYAFDNTFYYASLAKAICLIGLGRITEALDITSALASHSCRDETRLGILGYIKQQQGSYAEAARYYEDALKLDPKDPAAAAGLILNQTYASNFRNIDAALAILEKGPFATEKDRHNAQSIRAYALAARGHSREAAHLFSDLARNQVDDPHIYLNFARTLADLGQPRHAIDILRQGIHACAETLDLHQCLMDFLWSLPDDAGALQAAEAASRHYPDHPAIHHRLMLAYHFAGQPDKAKEQAKAYLAKHMPCTPDIFYYAGLANWILNKQERAQYDFERSARPPEEHYANLLSSPVNPP